MIIIVLFVPSLPRFSRATTATIVHCNTPSTATIFTIAIVIDLMPPKAHP